MIILAGSFRLAPGRREIALPHMQAMVNATRNEPGCIAYTFAFDILDDHLIQIFEVYENADALATHRASPHMAAWRAVAAEIGMSGRDLHEYDISTVRKIP